MSTAARSRYGRTTTRPKNDAYTGLLFISFLALVASCVLLYLDYNQYGTLAPQYTPQYKPGSNPGPVAGTEAPAAAPMGDPMAGSEPMPMPMPMGPPRGPMGPGVPMNPGPGGPMGPGAPMNPGAATRPPGGTN
jgi:hypothetical protein